MDIAISCMVATICLAKMGRKVSFRSEKVSPDEKKQKLRKAAVAQPDLIDLTGEEAEGNEAVCENVGCPIYKATAITFNEEVRILKGGVNIPERKICSQVPNLCSGRSATFVVRLNLVLARDLPCDHHGKWTNRGTSSQYFDRTGTRRDSGWRKPDKYDLQIRQTTYQNADAPEFGKKVYLGFDPNGVPVGDFALVCYHWSCVPYEFIPSAHGSAQKQTALTPYQRTKPTVLAEMRGLTSSLAPRQVVQQVSESHGGISGAAAMGGLPWGRSQAYNVAKHDPNSRRLSGAGKKKATDFDAVHRLCTTPVPDQFARRFDTGIRAQTPDRRCLRVFLASDRMLHLVRVFGMGGGVLGGGPLGIPNVPTEQRPLHVDTTFGISTAEVTVAAIRHPFFEDGNGNEPLIPVAFMLSNGKQEEDYKWFADSVQQFLGFADPINWISDSDPALVKAFEVN